MDPFSFILVILSAFLHAFWNLLIKMSDHKFSSIILFLLVAQAIHFPYFVYKFSLENMTWVGWICILITGLVHAFYFYFLGTAYTGGDLSQVYPLARSAPLFVPILAWFILGEMVSLGGALGIIIVCIGILILHLKHPTLSSLKKSLGSLKGKSTQMGLYAALSVSVYSIVDKVGVTHVDPFLYMYLMLFLISIFLLPAGIMQERESIRQAWRFNKTKIVLSSLACFWSYFLILVAMTRSPISYIISVRQASIVIGSIMGVVLLKEKHGTMRLIGSVLICTGVVVIGLRGLF